MEVGPGAPRPRLVLGLGNPGAEYETSRHNVGFRVVDELARRQGIASWRRECETLVAAAGDRLLLGKPQTYMNRSGYAALCLVERRGIDPGDLLVVLDDVNLPLGRLRLRRGGSPGGQRGLESILEELRTDEVPRLRLGVQEGEEPPRGEELVDYVLAPFAGEGEAVERMVERAADACAAWWAEGVEAAMNRFNG
jgi:PTH1 family peptidyl-tRNA hydrolase